MTPDSSWYQCSSFNWGLGWSWHKYLDWVPVSRNSIVKAGEPLCSLLELQEGRRFQISGRHSIPKIIFPFVFSQPGNPSSNPHKSFFLFPKPSSCSVFWEEREQLVVPEKQQPLKSAHPSTLWDSKYFSVRHLSVNYLTVAPTSMPRGAKPSWLS